MKLKYVNFVIDGIVVFVLKVLGAFGACWGSFSAASIAYREFGGGPNDVDFMSNPVYAITALGVSLGVATLSIYILVRDKLEVYYAQKKVHQDQDTDIAVTIPPYNYYQRNQSG